MEKQIKRNEKELKKLLDKYGSKDYGFDNVDESFYCRPQSENHFIDDE